LKPDEGFDPDRGYRLRFPSALIVMDANLPLMAASSALSSSFGDSALSEGLLSSPTTFPWLSLIALLPAVVAPLVMLLPGDGTDPKLPRSIASGHPAG